MILNTRPEQAGAELNQQLITAGLSSLHHPLFDIQPRETTALAKQWLNTTDQQSLMIWVSKHAVQHGHQLLAGTHYAGRHLAVGKATAQLVEQHTNQSCAVPNTEDSEGMIHWLSQQTVSKVAIIKGCHGRQLLSQYLIKQQITVTELDCYQRVPRSAFSLSQIKLWRQQIKHIIVTSGEAIELLYDQVGEANHHWLNNCQWFTISTRLQEKLNGLGAKDCINTGSANNQVLLSALKGT